MMTTTQLFLVALYFLGVPLAVELSRIVGTKSPNASRDLLAGFFWPLLSMMFIYISFSAADKKD